MTRTIIVALIALVVGAVVGVLGFTYIVGGSGEASGETTAPTLDVNAVATLNPTQYYDAQTQVAELSEENENLQATIEAMEESAAAEPTEEMVEEEATEEAPAPESTEESADAASVEEEATEEAAEAEATEEMAQIDEEAEATDAPEADSAEAGGRTLYRISTEESEVSFVLQEDLRGNRIDVVGTTNEVAGDIIIDTENPAASQIGTIRINARTLATDNQFRNRALRAEILLSAQDEYEFIEFVPTAVDGLPESIEMGETYTFDVTGDLTIAGVTNETTFTVEATLASAEQLLGTASVVVMWADWNITIPSVPGVANISEEVTLTINFVADVVTE